MSRLVEQALAAWGLGGADWRLAAERENRVFQVSAGERRLALRVRRPGYRTDREIRSELHWMRAMSAAGLIVPAPVPSLNAADFEVIDGCRVDMVTWLEGRPLGNGTDPLAHTDRTGTLRAVGRAAAKLHAASDNWVPPDGFHRAAWDADGLLGDAPLWGRFWDNPALPADLARQMLKFRDAARADLCYHGKTMDYGLIHADLVGENILIAGSTASLIDFDDGGPGYRLFELATLLNRLRRLPDYEELQAALLAGYREIRALDIAQMDLMIALRAVTYLGWIVPRLHEAGAVDRLARFIQAAEIAVARYLEVH